MNDRLREVFTGRRVLVTGHTGFKGSWLSLWLSKLGAEVTGYALGPEYGNSHFELLGLENHIHNHIIDDIRDVDHLKHVVNKFKPEIIFHLAAQALVRRSYDEPKETFEINVGGSVNVLEAVRNSSSVCALVYITSDKAYSNKEWSWGYRENDELGGHDPYSASKAAAEMAFLAYRESFFEQRPDLGVASTRAGNVIGGGDWAYDRIIPDCMRALWNGNPIHLRNPLATRPWQHVLDPLHGYLQLAIALLESPKRYSGPWNFGPELNKSLSVREVAEIAVHYWGDGHIHEEKEDEAPFENQLLQLSIDKAKLELNWHPRWSSERAIKKTIEWYKRVRDGAVVYDVSTNQIAEFMEEVYSEG